MAPGTKTATAISLFFDVQRFLVGQGIPHKLSHGSSGTEARMNCPVCGGKRNPFAINFQKSTAICYRCQWSPRTPEELVKELIGGNPFQIEILVHRYSNKITTRTEPFSETIRKRLEEQRGGPQTFDLDSLPAPMLNEELPPLTLPENFLPLGDPNIPTITDYAMSRGFSFRRMFDLGFGGCLFGKYEGCLIIPAYHGTELTFYQARDALDRPKIPRYRTPKGYSSTRSLFNIDEATKHNPVIICEGVFSAMRTGRDAVATFGNKISPNQIHLLLARDVKNVVLCFDPDTWSAPKAAIERGINVKPPILQAMAYLLDAFQKVRVVKLKEKDPDDTGTERMRELIDSSCEIKSKNDIFQIMLT